MTFGSPKFEPTTPQNLMRVERQSFCREDSEPAIERDELMNRLLHYKLIIHQLINQLPRTGGGGGKLGSQGWDPADQGGTWLARVGPAHSKLAFLLSHEKLVPLNLTSFTVA